MVRALLRAVRVDLQTNTPVLLLQETDGEGRTLPIFIGNPEATAIAYAIQGVEMPRPLTHDLIGSILVGLGTKLERIVINDERDKTFYARILLSMTNELGTKIVEIDARPSDSIVLSLQQKRPIYVARAVFDAAEDRTDVLEQWRKQQEEGGSDEP